MLTGGLREGLGWYKANWGLGEGCGWCKANWGAGGGVWVV